MNVGEIAKEWYEKNEPPGALASAILRCFFRGTIIRRPDFLLMGETCRSDGKKLIEGTPHNCWWIHFTANERGTVSPYDRCLEAPFQLDWVAFKRRGKIHIIAWEKLYNRDLYYGRSTECPSAKTT